MSTPFAAWAEQVQADMEVVLDRHLPPASALPTKLHQAMRYAVLGGGKRVRPLLVFAQVRCLMRRATHSSAPPLQSK